ncbi:M48 family metallopeptidase [Candidatus Falkowbacteria bacterium]|nr:M48 family metallopeptidase [Candidatus Falkowbacteria bacterium]
MLKILFSDGSFKIVRRIKRRKKRRSLTTAFSKIDFLKNKEKAREIILERLKHFSLLYDLSHGRVSIRNQKTRWGSCSKQGNLNFNYRLVHLREELLDYVIVHELCHLKEFNHGSGFWDLVAKTTPKHRELRRELKNIRI